MSKRTENLRKKLASGELSPWAWMDIASPMVAEILADAGFDWILVDTEHNPFNPETLLHILLAFRGSNTVPMIRVPENNEVMIKQVLDMGYEGVITPQTNTVKETRRAVSACRYPPIGTRGFGPMRPGGYYRDRGEYVRTANESIIYGIQIENICSANEIDDIVKVPGLDWILIGRYDMSASMGIFCGVEHPDLWKVIKKISDSSKRAGIPFGVPLGGSYDIQKTVDMGSQLVSIGRDSMYLQSTADNALKVFERFVNNRKK